MGAVKTGRGAAKSQGAAAPPGSAGLAARALALDAVSQTLRRRGALDEIFDALAAEAGLEARDSGLARAIAVVTFRRWGTIRRALEERLERGLPREERLVHLLAIGAAQVLFLDVPDHAAVDLSVRLAQSERTNRAHAGLVNAVLRRFIRERDAILAASDPLADDAPAWLAARWRAAYGEETAQVIATAHRDAASVDLTVRADPEAWAARLNGLLLPTGSLRLLDRTPVRELPGYEEGAWWVQDAAAALPARLLDVRPGERVVDLCAAPGGKTAQLAAAGAQVLAVDRSAKRLERLSANMARLGLAVETRAVDAQTLDAEPFDAVLLDAPCTATGTLRRHPDVAWTKAAEDVGRLADLQARLLDKAASLVRPGGRLVYCTCSLEPEEGGEQVSAFLARHPGFERRPIEAGEIGDLAEAVTAAGDLRTLPSHLGSLDPGRRGFDGFYAARLVRRS
ncbi:MAG TPA: 16S rRNA (cytosine(967)-C(5))-methyltransferase RsmB [Beijerinckiaceae bacterium]|jgi:16S rRNA (cytosine967-C5)-methyltransferase